MADKETWFRMCRNGETENVRMALSRGEDFKVVGESGDSAVMLAAEAGHLDVVAVLLEQGEIDVNSTNQIGRTALHMAALRGHVAIIELLLNQQGTEINQANNYGRTALHWAASQGHAPVVQVLLSKPGIEVNRANSGGLTALHLAASRGHINVLTLLCNFPGINLAATTKRGCTVLHKLVSYPSRCDPDFLRNLLTNLNVDPNAKRLDGNTTIMLLLLAYSNHNNVKECLRVMVESERVDILYVKDRQGRGLEDLAR